MSHTDFVAKLPEGFENIGKTAHCPNAAMQNVEKKFYGIQFHPEVYHSIDGLTILKNFVVGVCGCEQSWTEDSFIDTTIQALKEKLQDDKVVLGLSGGVDSSVAALLLHKAIGKNLNCIFVDNGLLRKNEFEDVLVYYSDISEPTKKDTKYAACNPLIVKGMAKKLIKYVK